MEDAAESNLYYLKQIGDANNKEIVDSLGGEVFVETYLFQIIGLLTISDYRESPLQFNGISNNFYVRDVNNKLWEVCLVWNGDGGWSVYAMPIQNNYGSNGGSLIFFSKIMPTA